MGASSSSSVRISSADQTVALGLCGVLMISRRVRGLMAAEILSKLGRNVPGVSGTRTGTPPARRMLGM
ncbi:hypothetical protein D3C78_1640520 [compost metagenome]